MKLSTSGTFVALLILTLACCLVSAGFTSRLANLNKYFGKSKELDPAVLAEQKAKLLAKEQGNNSYFCVGIAADEVSCKSFREEAAKGGDMASVFAFLSEVSCRRTEERKFKRMDYVREKHLPGADDCDSESTRKGRQAGEEYIRYKIDQINNVANPQVDPSDQDVESASMLADIID